MKIGILTFHWSENFGAVLQAYATREFLRSHNYDAQIVNYLKRSQFRRHLRFPMSVARELYANARDLVWSFRHGFFSQISAFKEFRKSEMGINSACIKEPKMIKGYDALITGSDQIWNAYITASDSAYFLDFVDSSTKRISYAASIGEDKLDDYTDSYIRHNINFIDEISVREKSAAEIVSQMTDKPISVVIDPVFLPSMDSWRRIAGGRIIQEPYALVYAIHGSLLPYDIVTHYAGTTGLKAYSIQYNGQLIQRENLDTKFAFKIGPKEFINLFLYADFVVTDSFHGTAFSLRFNKKFVAVPPKIRQSRIKDLLSEMQLFDRLCSDKNDYLNVCEQPIDYSTVNTIIERERASGSAFLLNAVGRKRD